MSVSIFNLTFANDSELQSILAENAFAAVFANTTLNCFMLLIYLLGLVCCFGLVMVSWFEKSGQAGHYRTLVNQLVSLKLDQLVILYVFGFGPYVSGYIFGPLPTTLCQFGTFIKTFSAMNFCLITVAISATKLAFRCFYKSIPVMDDKFVVVALSLPIGIWSFLACLFKAYIEERPVITERICSGTWSDKDLVLDPIPVPAFVAIGSFFANLVLGNICKLMKNRKVSNNQETQSSIRIEVKVDFDNFIAQLLSNLAFGLIAVTFILLIKFGQPSSLSNFPACLLYHCLISILPFFLVSVQFLIHFMGNKHVKKAALNAFLSQNNMIHVIH